VKIDISQRTSVIGHINIRLLLKHHPRFKTKFIRDAQAWTTAPEQWAVFLSQRRRWINSTIHNFLVLFSVPGLCGFCCFSMRFIVMLDLISTILQPVVVIYVGYIFYLLASHSDIVPITSLLLLAVIYGLQGIIFILRRKWEMVGYLMIYILAIPVYSFALPLHAFWNMDKFSW
jgi:chitin synthase